MSSPRSNRIDATAAAPGAGLFAPCRASRRRVGVGRRLRCRAAQRHSPRLSFARSPTQRRRRSGAEERRPRREPLVTRDVPGTPAANVGNEAAPRAPLDASEGVRAIRVGSNQPADPPAVRPEEYVEGTHLRYFDASNVEWSVVEVEVDREKVPSARGARCLLFSRKDCILTRVELPRRLAPLGSRGASGRQLEPVTHRDGLAGERARTRAEVLRQSVGGRSTAARRTRRTRRLEAARQRRSSAPSVESAPARCPAASPLGGATAPAARRTSPAARGS